MSRTPVTFSKKEFHASFKKKHPDVRINANTHLQILNEGGKAICDILLEEGQFKLANRIGDLQIRKFIPKGKGSNFAVMIADWEATRNDGEGKIRYQFNDHTGGYIYRFLWSKRKCRMITDKNMWQFKPIRSLKRKLAYVIKNKISDYPAGIDPVTSDI